MAQLHQGQDNVGGTPARCAGGRLDGHGQFDVDLRGVVRGSQRGVAKVVRLDLKRDTAKGPVLGLQRLSTKGAVTEAVLQPVEGTALTADWPRIAAACP